MAKPGRWRPEYDSYQGYEDVSIAVRRMISDVVKEVAWIAAEDDVTPAIRAGIVRRYGMRMEMAICFYEWRKYG